ncbi:hypothetical protein [Mesorhizobium sp. WSM3876]|uniref:hypothetical protein n=1 Tax=Mesorhizobium sp. WSM3876 TaxID=422277 RepID=UPI000BAF9F3A|nr:hypothetical protein [Mesorhizobium sp. WSM3876]PBB85740.1 hypothetical protein CK216_16575 [Mesorhizobium sp. WSM3876]
MQSVLNLTQKPAIELTPGELFTFTLSSSSSLAIFINRNSDGDPLFGVLSSPDFDNPLTWFHADEYQSCLSYGKDWVLEDRPLDPGIAPQDTDKDVRLFADGGAKVMRFMPPKGSESYPIHFDLVTNEPHKALATKALPIHRWAIWPTLEHFRSSRKNPLFEYPVT